MIPKSEKFLDLIKPISGFEVKPLIWHFSLVPQNSWLLPRKLHCDRLFYKAMDQLPL
jgi:hypothetical protein